MIKTRLLFGLLLLTMATIGSDLKADASRFKYITHDDGLSQSEVYSFLQDSRNFMWIGTVDGLNKFDGYHIEKFYTEKDNKYTLSNNTVRALAEDGQGRVWIGTDDGLSVYDPLTEKIQQIDIPILQGQIVTILSLLTDQKYMWFSSTQGLFRCQIKGRSIKELSNSFEQIKFPENQFSDSNQRVNAIIKTNDGSYWLEVQRSLLNFVIQEDGRIVFVRFHKFDGLNDLRNLTEDKDGNLWMSSVNEGVIRFNPLTRKMTRLNANKPAPYSLTSNTVSSIAFDHDGNMWVSTTDKGLNFIAYEHLGNDQINTKHYRPNKNDPYGLQSDLLYKLYVSRENTLWIGTIGKGAAIFDPDQKAFETYRIPTEGSINTTNSNFIRALNEDKKGNLWIGTHNNGLFIYDKLTLTYKKVGFENHAIFFIYPAYEDLLWVCGNHGISLCRYTNKKLQIVNETKHQQATFNIVKSRSDVYWSGSFQGINRIESKPGVAPKYQQLENLIAQKMSYENTRVLFYDSISHTLLAGTEGGGLNQIFLNNEHTPTHIKVYKTSNADSSISSNYIRSIARDAHGDIWLGTYEGVNKVIQNPKSNQLSFEVYSTHHGLPNNMIQSILPDDTGNLWLGTNNGLCRFNPRSMNIQTFNANDGLQSSEFSEHTAFQSKDGCFYFGGIDGFNSFFPHEIVGTKNKPTITVTDFYLFNKKPLIETDSENRVILSKSILLTDTIILFHDQNDIRFDFSAMVYTNPDKIKYVYKLEGYDKDWIYTDSEHRNANYTNLSFGEYTFRVKSTNIDGVWNDNERQIFIKILAPFALTPWAFFLYFIGFVLIILYLTTFSVMRITTKKKILLENDHNQKIHELDELRTRFFINISHDLRTPLTLILGPLKQLTKTIAEDNPLHSYVQLIDRNIQRLNYLIEQILDVRKAETGFLKANPSHTDIIFFLKEEMSHFGQALIEKNLTLNIINDQNEIAFPFDRDMIGKILFNLSSNAIKHSQSGSINIYVAIVEAHTIENYNAENNSQRYVKISIEDCGPGMSELTMSRIFERFYQNESASYKGFGIGLSHCKDLIDAHKGYIHVESQLGKSTTFSFYLPMDMKETTGNIESNVNISNMSNIIDEPDPSTINGLHSETILLVEDNADMREYLRLELAETYNILQAEDGIAGLKLAQKELPDLIVSDIMMPNMNGVEMCKELKSNVKTSHIPVIILTAKTDKSTKYKGLETGADDYVSKPFDIELLTLRIKNLLEQRIKLRLMFQQNRELSPSLITVTSADEKFLTQLMEEIEKGIPESSFSVNTLENMMGMSHANFYRKVKSLTGQSGKELLQSMRMKRAYQLLTNQNLRVSEVAYMVGFTNPKYFTKCFKEEYGVLPSAIESS
ncbi:response regulator [Reichenbachiella carrageenanivorans]|uniref:histidine kinase n=1 Tax=Reichenbachiella carrageenanivorans TaxID=2979869 RepID=A0ABY6DAT9_9BACT|nr:two-component regulator propeller domain-containing protein [Reichenbachiella carrageenanivorans]UXX80960.1 response regulator [Reichenbachiella carrageenanivorans]